MNAKIQTPMPLKHDWSKSEITDLFNLPFNDLLFQAQQQHRLFFNANQVQVSTLLSIKTGKCSEDCGYCPQSVRYETGLEVEPLMPLDEVIKSARAAKDAGSSRFCMGAAWRSPKDRDMSALVDMVKEVKAMELETCMTLGMLTDSQTIKLRDAGLDYYNHNLDTSPEYYGEVITTRTYQDRLDTLQRVRDAGIHVCSGGIVGMGETIDDRAGLMQQLANQETHPESVPINMLVKVEGTPLDNEDDIDPLDFVRTIGVAKIMMPASHIRLSAGRESMSDEMQALCFLAGASSVFYGEKLLTTANPTASHDKQLFERLGIEAV